MTKVLEEVFNFVCHNCGRPNAQTRRYPTAKSIQEAAQQRAKLETTCKFCHFVHPPGLLVNGEFNEVQE